MKKKFEQKMQELEQIVTELEKGDIDLDQSIDKYMSAMKLVKECDSELKKAEEQISKIVLENGETEDFKIEEEK
ncbi:MAG: exodeoxyribonuclease VII small subunit [Bacilli bacterium]|nr:exodeoxyribonuclease VII small subunit [Bacilli bacterium]